MEKFDSSCEPMDVDLSINSANTSHTLHNLSRISSSLENNVAATRETRTVKTYHINLKTEKKKRSLIKIVSSLIILCASIAIYLVIDLRCTDELNLVELRSILKDRVHDQIEAIDSFVDALDLSVDSKILFLYGSTGVGKTYTASLLLENIWNSSNVFHYTMPSLVNTFSVDSMFGINVCKTSIVIVDDLKQSDLITIKDIVLEIIRKSENLKKKVTIVLIFNCDVITKDLAKNCDDKFYEELSKSFDDIHTTKKFIKYEPLTQNTLKKCVKEVLGSHTMNDREYNSLLNNFDVTLDGCKGVYKKVKFLKN